MLKKPAVVLISFLIVSSPLAALAQVAGGTTTLCNIIRSATNLIQVFGSIILVIALVVVLYAAFLFITAGGNEETTKKARTLLVYALVGLAVALLAVFADNIVQELFGGGFLDRCLVQPGTGGGSQFGPGQ